MSGERKNTITKSATDNTTTKKGLSQGQADILIAIVAMTWGSSYLMMKIGLTGMPPFSIIALRFCIAFITVALVFLPKMKQMNLRTLGYGSILGQASVWCVCFSCSGNEIHDRFQCWIPGWYCICIRTGSTQLFKTQTTIQTYNSWSPFGFTWNLPAYISLHLYN